MIPDVLLYMKNIIAILFLSLLSQTSTAQKFWLLTHEFTQGPKTCIELYNDSTLLVGQLNSINISRNSGQSWDTTLEASYINKIYKSKMGRVFAGGVGKIYYTDNLQNWDSVNFNHKHIISGFAETNDALFISTYSFDTLVGHNGAGVFRSMDNGLTWQAVNNGINTIPSVQFIKSDIYDNIYIAIASSNLSPDAGLFYSSNNALTWNKINIQFDGKGAVENNANVDYFSTLDIINNDSLLISFNGVAGRSLVRLNLIKPLTALNSNAYWRVLSVNNSSMWWIDRPMGETITVKNNEWYSSIEGSLNVGGTLYSSNNGSTWWKHSQGLGTDIFGEFNKQYFVKDSKNKVYMIQYGDERVYWADTSQYTLIENISKSKILLYPNPISFYESLNIKFEDIQRREIEVYDLESKLIHKIECDENRTSIKFESPSIYIIKITENQKQYYYKIIVN